MTTNSLTPAEERLVIREALDRALSGRKPLTEREWAELLDAGAPPAPPVSPVSYRPGQVVTYWTGRVGKVLQVMHRGGTVRARVRWQDSPRPTWVNCDALHPGRPS